MVLDLALDSFDGRGCLSLEQGTRSCLYYFHDALDNLFKRGPEFREASGEEGLFFAFLLVSSTERLKFSGETELESLNFFE